MWKRLPLPAAVALALVLGLAAGEGIAERAAPPPAARPTPPTTAPRARDPEPKPRPSTEVVASFTTRYEPGQPRVTNIRRAAELLDETVLPPGARFSMNEALGERTLDRGFVAAPMVSGGRLVDSVGGGISQVATALYNAAFFAGLELVERTPHSFYIDRYPAGREATISWGGPELVFRNDWPSPLRMRLRTTPTSLTVRLYSARLGRRVETETLTPYGHVQPRTITVTNGTLEPGAHVVVQEAGAAGFTVEYTRRVYRFGDLIRDERFRTRYEPKNAIVEVPPGTPRD